MAIFPGRYSQMESLDFSMDKFHRYGPIVKETVWGGEVWVHLSNPKDFEIMFWNQGAMPERPVQTFVRHYRRSKPDKYASPGLSNSTGEEWSRLRKVLTPVLLKMKPVESILPELNDICDDFVYLIRCKRDVETDLISNIQDIAYRFALEGIYMFTMESRLGSLEHESKLNSEAAAMISSVRLLFEAFQELHNSLPLWKIYETKSYKKLGEAESTMYKAACDHIQEAMENLRTKSEDEIDDSKPGLLKKLLQTPDIPDKEIIAIIIDFISGGIFTISNALSLLLHNLSNNPDAQKKLYDEVQEIAPDGEITREKLTKMNYLKACIQESYRLTPTIPGIARKMPSDVVFSGYNVPAGTHVFSNFMYACKQPDMFPNPDKYCPERWLPENKDKIHTFALLPFGYGYRMCVGRRFAEVEMSTITAKIVYNFQLQSTGQKLRCKQDFIIVPSHPVSIIFNDR